MRFSFGSFANSSVTQHSLKGLEHTSPENPWLKPLSTIHHWRRRSSPASPDDHRRARVAGSPPRRPSSAAGNTASQTSSRLAFEYIALLLQGVVRSVLIRLESMRHWPSATFIPTGSPASRSAPFMELLIAGNAPDARVDKLGVFTFDLSQDGCE